MKYRRGHYGVGHHMYAVSKRYAARMDHLLHVLPAWHAHESGRADDGAGADQNFGPDYRALQNRRVCLDLRVRAYADIPPGNKGSRMNASGWMNLGIEIRPIETLRGQVCMDQMERSPGIP